MAQNPVALVTSVEDVVVMPDASHIVVTLDVGGPKVDLALEPDLALSLINACAKGYAESRDILKMTKDARTLLRSSGFELGRNDERGIIGLTMKFGSGGQISFALDEAMANSMFEMLGTLTGRAAPSKPTTRPN